MMASPQAKKELGGRKERWLVRVVWSIIIGAPLLFYTFAASVAYHEHSSNPLVSYTSRDGVLWSLVFSACSTLVVAVYALVLTTDQFLDATREVRALFTPATIAVFIADIHPVAGVTDIAIDALKSVFAAQCLVLLGALVVGGCDVWAKRAKKQSTDSTSATAGNESGEAKPEALAPEQVEARKAEPRASRNNITRPEPDEPASAARQSERG